MEMQMPLVQNKDDLASVITALPFGVLMNVANQLVGMTEDKDIGRDITTPLGLAECLYDWAEAQTDAQ
jgi:hypothetical protein